MQAQILVDEIKKFSIEVNKDVPKLSRFSFKQFMELPDLEHYMSIRGGNFFEAVLKNMVQSCSDCLLIQKKFVSGKQIDLLFINKLLQKIFYFEVKTNINTDSEKTPATATKISEVRRHLESLGEYSQYDLVYGMLCPTNIDERGISYNSDIRVYSLSEFLDFISVSHTPSELQKVVDSIRLLYKSQIG